MWLSGLSAGLWTEGLLVQLPVRAHAWAAGQVSSWKCVRGSQLMFLLYISVSLLFLPSPPSRNKKIKSLKKIKFKWNHKIYRDSEELKLYWKRKLGDSHILISKFTQSYSNQNCGTGEKTDVLTNRTEEGAQTWDLTYMVKWFSIRCQLSIQEGKDSLSTNAFRKTGYPHAKEWSWTLTKYHIQKLTQKWIKDLKAGVKTSIASWHWIWRWW